MTELWLTVGKDLLIKDEIYKILVYWVYNFYRIVGRWLYLFILYFIVFHRFSLLDPGISSWTYLKIKNK